MSARTSITVAFDGASDPVPVQSLHLDRDLGHPVGRAVLGLPLGVALPAPGQEVALSLVHSGTETAVMTGHAAYLDEGLRAARVTVLEHAARLMAPLAAKSYGSTTAGSVISDLCSAVDVPTGTVLPGATLPHIVLRSDQSALAHAKRLAALSGMALATDTRGALSTIALTVPVPGTPPSLERAAVDRVEHVAEIATPQTRVIGAGAMGSKGPGASTLPLVDVGLISSGSDGAGDTVRIAAIRTLADATLAELARGQRQSARGAGLTVHTPLPEELSPGDAVLLPDANGLPVRLARLEAVRVTVSAQAGLRASYRFSDLEAL